MLDEKISQAKVIEHTQAPGHPVTIDAKIIGKILDASTFAASRFD